MPQTLLAIAAIVAAGFLTLSQSRAVHSTTEAVMRDQFELAAAGALLHTLEFADARAFDEATTPEALRTRYHLLSSMSEAERDTISLDDLGDITPADFSDLAAFGGVVCNVQEPWQSTACDDLDDLHGGEWQEVDFKTMDGHPLPIEVRGRVVYVEASAPDVAVNYKTFHKRVEVQARSTVFKTADGQNRPLEVTLRRVISFDPAVAAEYLRRSAEVVGSCPAYETWSTIRGELQKELRRAGIAQAEAGAALEGPKEEFEAAAVALGIAQGQLDDAKAAWRPTDDAARAALQTLNAAKGAHERARRAEADRNRALSAAKTALAAAETNATAAQTALAAARTRASNAVTALATAKTAAAEAAAALATAQTRAEAAARALATAKSDADNARATWEAARAAADNAFYQGTYVIYGRRYWRSTAARIAYEAARDLREAAKTALDAADAAAADADRVKTDADAKAKAAKDKKDAADDGETNAQAEVQNARGAVTEAEAHVGVTAAALERARAAVPKAQAAYNEASAAVGPAARAETQAKAAYDAAVVVRNAAAAVVSAKEAVVQEAQTAHNAAQAAHNAALAVKAAADQRAADALAALTGHDGTRPNCG